jgi:hypothetical protein
VVGLTVPETHKITSRAAVEKILHNAPPGRKYIMKTIGVDDSFRADMTLLPKATVEQTPQHIARLRISESFPWILQQYLQGKEYCTHSLVINGQVKAFVACPSAELLMHYEALPADSSFSNAMLDFTKRYAAEGGHGFTGHLSFDFMVEEDDSDISPLPDNIVLYPIECNPRAHTAVALFAHTTDMVTGYLSILDSDHGNNNSTDKAMKSYSNSNGNAVPSKIITPLHNDKYYWPAHDLITLFVLPTFSFLTLSASLQTLLDSYATFVTHLVYWKDGTFELWDPLPWFWLYHVYWPMQFFACLQAGKKWSRVNVSTTKMFEC